MKDNGVPPEKARASARSISTLGVWVLIASLSVLFFASLLVYLIMRARQAAWPPPGLPELPPGLWLSTALILFSSFTLHLAVRFAAKDRQEGVRGSMLATMTLGLLFLLNQAVNWRELHAAGLTLQGIYGGGFYFMTALHAAHVLGGLLPMAFVTAAAFRGFYTRTSHHGLKLLEMYWHFLAVVWILLFVVLMDFL